MNPAAIVPYRPETAEREQNWLRTRQQWDALGWPVFTGDNSEADIFSRSVAINRAVAQTDADVLCICDVDFLFGDLEMAIESAQVALKEYAHVVPFSVLNVLDHEASQRVREGEDPDKVSILESAGMIWVCAAVVSRELFDCVKGLDERFIGYGEQDLAFLASTGTMGTKMRVNGIGYHLSHAEPDRQHSFRQRNYELFIRYRAADGDKSAMKSLIDER